MMDKHLFHRQLERVIGLLAQNQHDTPHEVIELISPSVLYELIVRLCLDKDVHGIHVRACRAYELSARTLFDEELKFICKDPRIDTPDKRKEMAGILMSPVNAVEIPGILKQMGTLNGPAFWLQAQFGLEKGKLTCPW